MTPEQTTIEAPPKAVQPPSTKIEPSPTHDRLATNMRRDINWRDAFFISAGVPGILLFSLGGASAIVGAPAWLAWTLTVLMGFVFAFTYAEIAGLHPKKSGGTAVHGATAWIRYSKFMAPLSLWSCWLAWTPVLAFGSQLGAGYLLSVFFAADARVNTWSITLLDLGFLKDGLTLRINAVFIVGAMLLGSVWTAQHRGILRTARIQTILAISSLTPLAVVTLVPLVSGSVVLGNFSPFTPLALDGAGSLIKGAWNLDGWRLFFGAMFIASWAAYAFETAVCYMSEFKNPRRDGPRAIIYSGLLCIAFYVMVPVVWQGVLGTAGMLKPGVAAGTGMGEELAGMLQGGIVVTKLVTVMLILTLLTAVMTSMSGSSRTLFQGGVDGWLPKYLSHLNAHKVPTYAMWTDLGFNLFLLLMSDYLFIMAISNVNYIIYIWLTVNAGWIHRIDNAKVPRPYKISKWVLGLGTVLAFFNAFMMGAGANVWGKSTLFLGFLTAFVVFPIFLYRHYITDKGVFPTHMNDDLLLEGEVVLAPTRAGVLPYLALATAAGLVAVGYAIFWV